MATASKRKSKRSTSRARPRQYSQLYKSEQNKSRQTERVGNVTVASNEVVEERHASQYAKGSDTVDWKGEYGYVLRDLRILGVVSFILFAVIISAVFFL